MEAFDIGMTEGMEKVATASKELKPTFKSMFNKWTQLQNVADITPVGAKRRHLIHKSEKLRDRWLYLGDKKLQQETGRGLSASLSGLSKAERASAMRTLQEHAETTANPYGKMTPFSRAFKGRHGRYQPKMRVGGPPVARNVPR